MKRGVGMKSRRGHTIVLLSLLAVMFVFFAAFLKTCMNHASQVEPVPAVVRPAEPVFQPEPSVPSPALEPEPVIEAPLPPVEISEPVAEVPVAVPVPVLEPAPAFIPEIPVDMVSEPVVSPPVPEAVSEPEALPVPEAVPVAELEPVLPLVSEPVAKAIAPAPTFASQPAVRVVAVPEIPVEPLEPRVPEAPFLFEPTVYTMEDWYTFFATPEPVSQSGDDPFADFFVSGEDSIVYDDGLYYMGLYINDEYAGDIEVLLGAGTQSLNSAELSLMLSEMITNEAYQAIFGNNEEYVSLSRLTELGISVEYNPSLFVVRLVFGVDMMPVRSISVSSSYMSRRDRYSLSGSEILSPAKFSWISHLSLYSLLDVNAGVVSTSQLFSMSVTNNLSILGVGLDFTYQVNQNSPYFHFSSWRGFYDFADQNIRMSFGNIGSGIGSYSGTSLGLSFEKNYSYGTGSAKSSQYEQTITLQYRSTVEIIMNDRSVFKRELAAGTYRLRDFLFSQGANSIDVIVTPVDPADGEEYTLHMNLGYDSRLLARGESLWGVSFSFPRDIVAKGTGSGLTIPWFNDRELDYQFQNFSAQYWQQTGMADIFTLSSTFSITRGLFLSNFSGVLATTFGTLQGAMAVSLSPLGPGYSTKLSHRYSASNSWFGSIDTSVGYTNSTYSVSQRTGQTPSVGLLTGSLSFSGRIGSLLRFSVGSNITLPVDTFSPDWSIVTSVGMSPVKGLSISGSFTATATRYQPDKPTIRGTLSVSYSFGSSASISANTDFNTGNSLNVSWRPGSKKRDTLQLNLSGINFSDLLNHNLLLSWSHVGDLYSMSVRQQFYNSYKRSVTSLSLNTSFVFADGAFGMARSISDNFLLVKPTGTLKGGAVSVGRSMDSSPTVLKTALGSAVYNNISSYTRNNVVVFGSSDSLFGSGSTFVYEMTPRSRQGFVARISMQPSYTVSGRLFKADGEPYVQYSSPVYRIGIGDDGLPVLTPVDEYYLFTDQEGRYIISDIQPGQYMFDLQVGDDWYAVRFDVPEFSEHDKADANVLIYSDYYVGAKARSIDYQVLDETGDLVSNTETDVFGTLLADEYSFVVFIRLEDRLSEQVFWDTIFPMFDNSFETDPFFANSESGASTASTPVDQNAVPAEIEYVPQTSVAP